MTVATHDGCTVKLRECCSVVALFEPFVRKVFRKNFVDQLFGREASGTVRHVDAASFKVERSCVRRLNAHE